MFHSLDNNNNNKCKKHFYFYFYFISVLLPRLPEIKHCSTAEVQKSNIYEFRYDVEVLFGSDKDG